MAVMSKRTRSKDNSKRAQPVQQQRAQAAQQALARKNIGKSGDSADRKRERKQD
jgi:hypothetical protein